MGKNLTGNLPGKTSSRDLRLDLLRILATFMVILLHASASRWSSVAPTTLDWKVLDVYGSLVRAAVPLFFMISGYLFLSRKELSIRKLYLHNILHLVIIYILWSLFYAVDALGIEGAFHSWNAFLSNVIETKYHLWFLPVITGIYILLPILYAFVHYQNGKYIKYFIIIFLLFGIVRKSILMFPLGSDAPAGILNKIVPDLCGYSGYFVLGYYLSKLNSNRVKIWALLAAFFGSVFVCAFGGWYYSISMGKPYDLFLGYLSITTMVEAVALFLIFRKIRMPSQKSGRIIKYLSACTLGIYVLHPFVLDHLSLYFKINALFINPIFGAPLVALMGFAICTVVIMVLKRIPFVNRWLV